MALRQRSDSAPGEVHERERFEEDEFDAVDPSSPKARLPLTSQPDAVRFRQPVDDAEADVVPSSAYSGPRVAQTDDHQSGSGAGCRGRTRSARPEVGEEELAEPASRWIRSIASARSGATESSLTFSTRRSSGRGMVSVKITCSIGAASSR